MGGLLRVLGTDVLDIGSAVVLVDRALAFRTLRVTA
jgi:hypothetical protein